MLVFITFTPGVTSDTYDDSPETSAAIKSFQHTITIVTYAGVVPAMALGYFLSWLRLRYFHVTVIGRFRWRAGWVLGLGSWVCALPALLPSRGDQAIQVEGWLCLGSRV